MIHPSRGKHFNLITHVKQRKGDPSGLSSNLLPLGGSPLHVIRIYGVSWVRKYLAVIISIMEEVLKQIVSDPRYINNTEYGEPRSGHPEGKVKYHIVELENNLEKLVPRISEEQYWKLQFLIHVHDAFKADAVPDSPIASPNSHASLARKFAAEFIDDQDLLNMVQFHDVNFALWKQFAATGSYDKERFESLLNTIVDWNLFLMFLIIDGNTEAKDPTKVAWFIAEVRKHKNLIVDETWLL